MVTWLGLEPIKWIHFFKKFVKLTENFVKFVGSGGGKMFPSIHSRLPGGGFSLDSTPYGRPPLYHPHRSYSGVPSAGGTVAPSLLADPRLYNVRLPMSSSSETLMAYSKLMSSSAQFQRPAASTMAPSAGGSLSSSPVENLEKLAALAAVSSAPTISTPPAPKTAAGNWRFHQSLLRQKPAKSGVILWLLSMCWVPLDSPFNVLQLCYSVRDHQTKF